MKKVLLLTTILSSSIFATTLKDGFYTCRSEKSMWSWYPYTTMTVKDGEITSVYHDRIKADGSKASNDEKYCERMLSSSKSSPKLYSEEIPKNFFKANKDLNAMDTVAGATDSVLEFKKELQFLIEKAETVGPGNYVIENSKLK